jgi:hypothetical protein
MAHVTHKNLAHRLKRILPNDITFFDGKGNNTGSSFDYYYSLSGHVDNSYFDIYIHRMHGRETTEICKTTHNRAKEIITNMINSLNPNFLK